MANNTALNLLSTPIVYSLGKTRLDYKETFLVGCTPCDVMNILCNAHVDNAILLMIKDLQPHIGDNYVSTMIESDLNSMQLPTMGRTFDVVYRLSDKFNNKTIRYYSTTDAPSTFVITTISREDGLTIVIPSSLTADTLATLQTFLIDHANERLLCILMNDTSGYNWDNFNYSNNITSITTVNNNVGPATILLSRSACNYATTEFTGTSFTLYYESDKTFDIFPSEIDIIPGLPYKLDEISDTSALSLMNAFYGAAQVKIIK